MFPPVTVNLSGDRFQVTYLIPGDEACSRAWAEGTALEQTVELSASMIPEGDMHNVMGWVETVKEVNPSLFEVKISYAVETTGFELIQFLNVIWGNTSMKSGGRVLRVELPDSLLDAFVGPRFGMKGLRKLLKAPKRPLLGTALKPMGYPSQKLADLAYRFALGGIDIIKDDHGLADQSFHRFDERVRLCVEAVQLANKETGGSSLYVPNVSGPVDQIVDKARYACEVGVGGIELCSGIVGIDMVRILSQDDSINLPIFSHTALLGTYVVNPREGLSYEFLYGQVMRLAGADAVIYPGHGGRFPAAVDDCRRIVAASASPMGGLKPLVPMPGGGMTIKRIPEMLDIYGLDVILLISGDLFAIGPSLVDNCHSFRDAVDVAYAKMENGASD